MKHLSIHIPGEPPRATAQQRKVFRTGGKVRAVDPKHVAEAKRYLGLALKRYAPQEPLTGPLCVDLVFTFGWLCSDTNRTKSKGWRWKKTSPDCDNQAKIILDVMTRLGFWLDDNQIAGLNITKKHGNIPGITIDIKELRQPYEL